MRVHLESYFFPVGNTRLFRDGNSSLREIRGLYIIYTDQKGTRCKVPKFMAKWKVSCVAMKDCNDMKDEKRHIEMEGPQGE